MCPPGTFAPSINATVCRLCVVGKQHTRLGSVLGRMLGRILSCILGRILGRMLGRTKLHTRQYTRQYTKLHTRPYTRQHTRPYTRPYTKLHTKPAEVGRDLLLRHILPGLPPVRRRHLPLCSGCIRMHPVLPGHLRLCHHGLPVHLLPHRHMADSAGLHDPLPNVLPGYLRSPRQIHSLPPLPTGHLLSALGSDRPLLLPAVLSWILPATHCFHQLLPVPRRRLRLDLGQQPVLSLSAAHIHPR